MKLTELFTMPFRAFCDGGYAGLVFVASRTADAPGLQRGFLESWRDIDDLTGRYLGVIVPSPEDMLIGEERNVCYECGLTKVKGVRCLGRYGNGFRLALRRPDARSVVRMDWREPPRDGFVPPKIAGTVSLYQDSLTDGTKNILEYFGISESLLPCAVIVSLTTRRAYVVQLGETGNVYRLLKSVMTHVEPISAHGVALDAAVVAAQRERRELRIGSSLADRERRAAAVIAEWQTIKGRLTGDLAAAADRLPPSTAGLCRWMVKRFDVDEPVRPHEWDDIHTLRRSLARAETFGRLPRRLMRTVAKLNAGHPRTHDAVVRFDARLRSDIEIQTRLGDLKAQLTEHADRLRLGDAVDAAAAELRLTASDHRGLLPRRMLRWPVTSFVKDTSATFDRGTTYA